MNTARRFAAFTAALMGCSPAAINTTTTGESEGGEESSTTETPSGSTGPESTSTSTGRVDTSTSSGASSSGVDSGSTTGGGESSSSSGDPPPVCLVGEVDTDGDGDPDTWICDCEGEHGDPAADCGCVTVDASVCECNGIQAPIEVCLPFGCVDITTGECLCELAQDEQGCFCGTVPVSPNYCG